MKIIKNALLAISLVSLCNAQLTGSETHKKTSAEINKAWLEKREEKKQPKNDSILAGCFGLAGLYGTLVGSAYMHDSYKMFKKDSSKQYQSYQNINNALKNTELTPTESKLMKTTLGAIKTIKVVTPASIIGLMGGAAFTLGVCGLDFSLGFANTQKYKDLRNKQRNQWLKGPEENIKKSGFDF